MADLNSHWTQYCLYHHPNKIGFISSMKVHLLISIERLGQARALKEFRLHVLVSFS